jgi:predicted dehydrogenase
MIVLVVGYGSIGRRHVTNLLNLDAVEKIVVYTRVDSRPAVADERVMFVSPATVPLDRVSDIMPFDCAVIANETHLHMDTALELAAKGIYLFIEKPVSHNLEKTDYLLNVAGDRGVFIFVGYNLRFLGAIQVVKQAIERKTIGDLYLADIEAGQFLPQWRPDTDYRTSYSAHKNRGGGVALDLSHELDYMLYLFGAPAQWKTMKSKVSDLEIDAEDVFAGIYRYADGFLCTVRLDYLQKKKTRRMRIVGSRGHVTCDLVEKTVRIMQDGSETVLHGENLFDMTGTYVNELSYFMESVAKRATDAVNLRNAISVLKLIES